MVPAADKAKIKERGFDGAPEEGKDRICFVIAPIGSAGSETRKRSDQVLKHIIGEVVEPLGYRPERADQISESGLITSQVIRRILDAPLVIADLTDQNPNVFYELALRHAIRKPFIQVIQKGQQIPFDIANLRTIEMDVRDLDSVAEAKTEIRRQVQAFENPDAKVDSPISVAIDIEELYKRGNPEGQQIANILAVLSDLRAQMAQLATAASFVGVPTVHGGASGVQERLPEAEITRSARLLDDDRVREAREAMSVIPTPVLERVRDSQISKRDLEELVAALGAGKANLLLGTAYPDGFGVLRLLAAEVLDRRRHLHLTDDRVMSRIRAKAGVADDRAD